MRDEFGAVLREWRGKRKLSQLELGFTANVSARHIAFLETGRSRPSRSMVLALGDALDAPPAERNRMLDAAGFRPAFRSRAMDVAEMEPVRLAIERIIDRHEPYPALVADRHWRIVQANRAGTKLFGAFGMAQGASLLDAFTGEDERSQALRAMIENWPDVAAQFLARLRTESAHLGGDPVLDAAAARLARDPAIARVEVNGDMPPFIAARYRIGDHVFSVLTTIAQFGTAQDVALADLRIELFFPADAATAALFEAMA